MKSIAFYVGDFTRSGGTERSCITVANGLSKNTTLKVFLITTSEQQQQPFFEINPNVKIIYLNISTPKIHYIVLIYRLIRAIQQNNITLLVAVEVMSLLFVFPAFLYASIPKKLNLIVWEHFNFSVLLGKKMRGYFRKLSAKFATKIVVLTQTDARLWQENLKIKGEILPIANPSPYQINTLAYNHTSKNIIAIGRLTYQKGFDRLISIWHKLNVKYPQFSDWQLKIIGSGIDEESLKTQINQCKLSNQVAIIPNTPAIHEHYKEASLLAMTSRFEGLPMTLIEAQSFGLPIIAYDCKTGPSEIISENSGLLIADENEEHFVEGLKQLMADENLRIQMSENAKVEALRFSEKNSIEKWSHLINDL